MLKFLIVLSIGLNAHSKVVEPPKAQSRLPFVIDYQFAPLVGTILYGSAPKHYESIIQFFGEDKKNPVGRFCKLDDNSTPFDCVFIKPNIDDMTCTIAPYTMKVLPVSEIEHDKATINNIVSGNFVALADQPATREALLNVGFDKIGSPRTLNVPAMMKLKFSDQEVANAEYNKDRNTPGADVIYYGKLACYQFFGQDGAMERFSDARSSHVEQCARYNEAAVREGAKLRDCTEAANSSNTPLTHESRSNRPKIKINLNPFKAAQ